MHFSDDVLMNSFHFLTKKWLLWLLCLKINHLKTNWKWLILPKTRRFNVKYFNNMCRRSFGIFFFFPIQYDEDWTLALCIRRCIFGLPLVFWFNCLETVTFSATTHRMSVKPFLLPTYYTTLTRNKSIHVKNMTILLSMLLAFYFCTVTHCVIS